VEASSLLKGDMKGVIDYNMSGKSRAESISVLSLSEGWAPLEEILYSESLHSLKTKQELLSLVLNSFGPNHAYVGP